MSQTQTIRDARGLTLGRITTDASGRQRATNAQGITVGYYDPETDKTTDARGIKIAQGNILAALIIRR